MTEHLASKEVEITTFTRGAKRRKHTELRDVIKKEISKFRSGKRRLDLRQIEDWESDLSEYLDAALSLNEQCRVRDSDDSERYESWAVQLESEHKEIKDLLSEARNEIHDEEYLSPVSIQESGQESSLVSDVSKVVIEKLNIRFRQQFHEIRELIVDQGQKLAQQNQDNQTLWIRQGQDIESKVRGIAQDLQGTKDHLESVAHEIMNVRETQIQDLAHAKEDLKQELAAALADIRQDVNDHVADLRDAVREVRAEVAKDLEQLKLKVSNEAKGSQVRSNERSDLGHQEKTDAKCEADPQHLEYSLSKLLSGIRMTNAAKVSVFTGDPKEYQAFKETFQTIFPKVEGADNMLIMQLREYLSPEVRQRIAECFTSKRRYSFVWERLDEEFGDQTASSLESLNDLLDLPTIKANDLKSLRAFTLSLHATVVSLIEEDMTSELQSNCHRARLEAKLPIPMLAKWIECKNRMKTKCPTVVDLDDWLTSQLRLQEETDRTKKMDRASPDLKSTSSSPKGKGSLKSSINHVSTSDHHSFKVPDVRGTHNQSSQSDTAAKKDTDESDRLRCFVCKGPLHKISSCKQFMSLSPTGRAEAVYSAGRCLKCVVGKGHVARDCPKKDVIKCTVGNCANPRHPTVLHGSRFRVWKEHPKTEVEQTQPSLQDANQPGLKDKSLTSKSTRPERPHSPIERAVVGAMKGAVVGSTRGVLFKIVPVRLKVGRRTYDTFAFLDSGSDTTIIKADVAKSKLGLCCRPKVAQIAGYDGKSAAAAVSPVDFTIMPRDETVSFSVRKAYAVQELNVAQNPKITEDQWASWPNFSDLGIKEATLDDVSVLIGLDVAAAHEYSERRSPGPGLEEPIAYKTPFGWCLGGKTGPPTGEQSFISHIVSRSGPAYDLDDLVRQFWHIEAKDTQLEYNVLSESDRRGLNILESTIKNVGDRYEVGLMWKRDDPSLPDNRSVALQRLFALERRFQRDPAFATKYHAVVSEYIELKHARLLSSEEARIRTGKTWYLPHHGVVSPSSTTTKVRVVFDGAAQCEGTSLNEHLLKGPNYLVNLIGVLLRFRRHQIAVGADIEKMYHQVLVRPEDRQAFRFFYRPPGCRQPPKTYEMQVHVFGAVSSPSTCLFVLNKTADDNQEDFPEAARDVRKSFYVDNYLDSFESEGEAIQRARQMVQLLARGGFKLTKWTSASRQVLTDLKPLGLATPNHQLDLEALPIERTLGIQWNQQKDAFTFKVNLSYDPKVKLTKRECLSLITSVFDPLGLVAPVVLRVKILLRELWSLRKEIGWDDEIPDEFRIKCYSWCESLKYLNEIQVPRCLRHDKDESVTLHVFTDASQEGLGAVAYVRNVGRDGDVNLKFVMAKTHVAPTKGYSIPRLELEAAVEGLKLARLICQELEFDVKDTVFHTDSQTVLHWINSKHCKFEVFVANRVGKILLATDCRQWHHVPGVDNPADICSRGVEPDRITELKLFHKGPDFLLKPPSTWPKWDASNESVDDDSETLKIQTVISVSDHRMDVLIDRFSNLVRLQRVVAWCKRYVRNLYARAKKRLIRAGELTVEELQDALTVCIRRTQDVAFPEELKQLRNDKELSKHSKLLALRPFIGDDGLIRVGGRLRHAPIDYAAKYPIILPADHRLTRLIIRLAHIKNHHVKSESLISLLRTEYWILSCRRVSRSAIRHCLLCRIRDAKPCTQLMGSLPIHRLTPNLAPFCHTGVDFFGPVMVKMGGRGRRHEKRWVSMFTCLATRAVHLELVDSLSTDAFLCCLTRFSAIRGKPRVMYSDNGLNFVGAHRELKEAVRALHEEPRLQAKLTQEAIEWHFSPPYSPHFGGVWERLIQASKRTINAIINRSIVTESILRTVLCETMALLNSRPLTHLSVDPDDPDPLTPNHFLLGRPQPYSPIKPIDVTSFQMSQRQYEQAQLITEHFWKRWIKEYVPSLTERRKWKERARDLEVGDLVLVIDDNSPRGTWPTGIIVETFPNKMDNVVRVVKVKMSGHHKPSLRSLSKLCLLMTNKELKNTAPVDGGSESQ